ncbi:YdcH family protein [Xenorhabdus bovienii]|uniref:YdcH family protein n=1 Tax=Xenorhabdus bovienii TaxID=40576 RepID=A0AAJ1JAM5_XENBV|nr:YdcH family protein [Xenorhabdus bovienii]MDE1478468.1 YdcH family protein [Xenorhabdus bovienii]MDE1481027.1 YdcH family protein [Xenorhabdus bovienii]MDE1486504.1 YdcH family protein [Xenorhabdus bovienii]MDE1491609.1 YdcH family protein [Xenorhabdus bovienii]MDE1496298.1 YdcH family protein [Xenorhabdus bovienii]
MFPEYRDLVSSLKESNPRFQSLFEKHNRLNHEISQLEGPNGTGYSDKVVRLKKEKLHIKDEMQRILQAESQR